MKYLGAALVRGDLTSLHILRSEGAEADAVIYLPTASELFAGIFGDILPSDMAAVDAIAEGLAGSKKALFVKSGTLAAATDPTRAEFIRDAPLQESSAGARNGVEAHALSLASKGIGVVEVRPVGYVYGRGGSATKWFTRIEADQNCHVF